MSNTAHRKLWLAPFVAVGMMLSLAVAAYACTNYVGIFHVWGDSTGYASGADVIVTGNDSWNGSGAMTESVNSTIAKAHKYVSGTTCGTSRGCFKVKTGVSGSNSLNPTTGDIWYDVNTIPVGYTSHTTWGGDPNYDCMDWILGGASGVKNVGSVKVHTDGTITAATNGSQGTGTSVTVSSGVAGPFFVASNETTATTNAHESGVCISDTTSTNGSQAPLTLV